MGSGGIFGGLVTGTQTQLAFIPERSTDFVFSGYAEEFGFLVHFFYTALCRNHA